MSETKFTPGPWVVTDSHLIAAAPELYEALNDLLNDCINFDGGKLTDVFMEKASRALKKARGETAAAIGRGMG